MCPVAVLPCAQSISAPGQAQTVCTGDHYSDGLVNSSTKFNHLVNMLNLSVYILVYLRFHVGLAIFCDLFGASLTVH